MEDIEILRFEDVLMTCQQFVDDPANDEKFAAVDAIKSKIVVKTYLSMSQKENIIHKILKDLEYGDPPYDFCIELETFLIMDGLLAYTNIDSDISLIIKTADTCDVLEYSGILDYIRESCQRDFDRITHMVENELSWHNIQELSTLFDSIDGEKIDSLTNSFKAFTSEENTSMLAQLEKILEFDAAGSGFTNQEVKEAIYKGLINRDKQSLTSGDKNEIESNMDSNIEEKKED